MAAKLNTKNIAFAKEGIAMGRASDRGMHVESRIDYIRSSIGYALNSHRVSKFSLTVRSAWTGESTVYPLNPKQAEKFNDIMVAIGFEKTGPHTWKFAAKA